MNMHAAARVLAAGAAVVALAGCSASASTSAGGNPGPGPTTGSASGSATSAAPVPFPVAVGNTWVYRTTLGTATAAGTTTDTIVSVTPVSGGRRVTMSYRADVAGARTSTRGSYLFYSNGTIAYPLAQVSGVQVVGNGVMWPDAAGLASGRPYRSALRVRLLKVGPVITETAHVTVRGEGTQTVTVPAGRYLARVVDMTMTLTVTTYTTTIEIKTWVAGGVGPVKSEALTRVLGHTEVASVEQLRSFTRG